MLAIGINPENQIFEAYQFKKHILLCIVICFYVFFRPEALIIIPTKNKVFMHLCVD